MPSVWTRLWIGTELLLKLMENSSPGILFLFSSEDRERKRHLTLSGGSSCPLCKYTARKISQSSEFTSVVGLQPRGGSSSHLPASPAQSDQKLLQFWHNVETARISGQCWRQELSRNLLALTWPPRWLCLHCRVGSLGNVKSFGFDCDITCKPQAPPRNYSGLIEVPTLERELG